MLWLLNGKQNFHLPEGQQKSKLKQNSPPTYILKLGLLLETKSGQSELWFITGENQPFGKGPHQYCQTATSSSCVLAFPIKTMV